MNKILITAAAILLGLAPFTAKAQVVTTPSFKSPVSCGLPCSGEPAHSPATWGPAPLGPTAMSVAASPVTKGPTPVGPVASGNAGLPASALVPYTPNAIFKSSANTTNVATSGTPILGGLVTMVEIPEAPMGAGITIAHD